jgi:alanyl-tRNA synthetase
MLTANELRQKYLDFFKSKGHAIIPSASLIPENDPSLLFVNSGMFPLVPYLLGEKHPLGSKLADSQKSFRTEDIEDVGDSRHNTFFEMLGNWSLGDYFKEKQLNWWFEFMIDELKLDINKIYQSVYAGDEIVAKDNDSIKILKAIYDKHGIKAEEGPVTIGNGELGSGQEIDFNKYRIFAYKDKNWWKRGDAVGELGGPDSETFYDTGKKHNLKFGQYCHINCDCGRFLEIGNSVFMQYKRTATGWEELTNKNVDFGGGLERIVMVSQGKNNIFETDLFLPLIETVEKLSGKKYQDNAPAFEIIADHLKAATFLLGDDKGLVPANTDQGYVIRRLIRRAVRYGKMLGINTIFSFKIAEAVIAIYEDIYPELKKNRDFIINQLIQEEEKFAKTLSAGLIQMKKLIEEKKKHGSTAVRINNDTKESAMGLNILSGKAAFDLYQTYGFPFEMIDEELASLGDQIAGYGFTYSKNELQKEFQEELNKHQELSRTASAGMFKGGLADTSEQTTKLHTAAHLMLAALRQVLGPDVYQKGSNITAERLRFDFSFGQKMTPEQIKKVEEIVNDQIFRKIAVASQEMSINDANKSGAMGVFGHKYGDKVKVFTIGDFSKEICGGPHVDNTGSLGHFKIQKEESSSAGVRRIKAILE